jgi:hypothetical protein
MTKRRADDPRPPRIQPVRPGMPAKDSVRKVVTKVAPTGLRFRIIQTTEMDSYDKPRRSRKKGK